MEIQRQIEKYLEDGMSEMEKAEFEKSLATDKELTAEFILHKEVNEAILNDEVEDFRKKVRTVIDAESSAKRQLGQLIIKAVKIPLAAAVIILISVSLYKIIIRSDPSEIYSSFYKPYDADLTVRSDNRFENSIDLSYVLYEKGNYSASFEMLNNYIAVYPNDQTAHFYLGLNAMELHLFDRAIDEFTLVEKDPSSPYAMHSQWYLALACLRSEKINEAKVYLQILAGDKDNFYSEEARRLLKKLRT